MVVAASSSQSVDRLVGTAAIVGLSLALAFQWITGNDADDNEQDDNEQQLYHDSYNDEPIAITRPTNTTAVATATSSPSSRAKSTNNVEVTSSSSSWWWPITLMTRRRKKKRRKRHYNNNNHSNSRNGNSRRNIDTNYDNIGNADVFDHLGSCECGSIQFILKGPRHLQPIIIQPSSPSSDGNNDGHNNNIQHPHIKTTADNFQLLQGESDMRFQYVHNNNNDDAHYNEIHHHANNNSKDNDDGDDSSTIATEHNHEERHHHLSSIQSSTTTATTTDTSVVVSLGAHVFCGVCSVQVMYADRSSEELEVNANCLLVQNEEEDEEEEQRPIVKEEEQTQQKQQQQTSAIQQQTSSLSSLSTIDGEVGCGGGGGGGSTTDLVSPTTQTQLTSVSEHELFLGSAEFWGSLDNKNHLMVNDTTTSNSSTNNSNSTSDDLQKMENTRNHHHQRKESISSMGEQTHPESYTTMLDTPTETGDDVDDYSMDGSLSVAHSLSVMTTGERGGSGNSGLLPPLPPGRLHPPLSTSSDSRSVRTLPPWFGERPGFASRSVGGNWSVASSMDIHDLDSVTGDAHTVSPRMRDQMKHYIGRHMTKKEV